MVIIRTAAFAVCRCYQEMVVSAFEISFFAWAMSPVLTAQALTREILETMSNAKPEGPKTALATTPCRDLRAAACRLDVLQTRLGPEIAKVVCNA